MLDRSPGRARARGLCSAPFSARRASTTPMRAWSAASVKVTPSTDSRITDRMPSGAARLRRWRTVARSPSTTSSRATARIRPRTFAGPAHLDLSSAQAQQQGRQVDQVVLAERSVAEQVGQRRRPEQAHRAHRAVTAQHGQALEDVVDLRQRNSQAHSVLGRQGRPRSRNSRRRRWRAGRDAAPARRPGWRRGRRAIATASARRRTVRMAVLAASLLRHARPCYRAGLLSSAPDRSR